MCPVSSVGCRFGFGEAWAAQERPYVKKSHDTPSRAKHNINKQITKHDVKARGGAAGARRGAARRAWPTRDGRGWRA